jgi:hypothetical protein
MGGLEKVGERGRGLQSQEISRVGVGNMPA